MLERVGCYNMKVLYFDCFSGISGDMVIGALMDLGVEEEVFRRELGKLKLSGYDFIIKKIVKNSIAVTDFKVVLEQDICAKYDKAHEHLDCGNVDGQKEHQHFDENSSCIDELQHSNHHDHHHNDDHSHTHNHARNLKDIEELIDSSDLSDKVKEFSKKVFSEIAFAEAKVHNMAVEEVHFHEVGAVDSIVDIVGTAICLDLLEIEKVYSSPLHDGTGFIECQHGRLPVPVPAVMEMLTNGKIPYIVEDINTELVTPTGMGIIKCLAHSFGNIPKMQITKVGYGGGKRDTGRLNALRCIMGTMKETSNTDEIVVLKTNIDDMNPEILGFVMDKLFEVGALDVYYTPVYMKKNRPAIELTVLCDEDKEQFIVDIILKETTTLGIRKTLTQRYKMDRETVKVNTKYGEVRVKVSKYGEFKKYSPEYEDLREISRSKDIPLWKVYNAVCEKGI
jgi:uncharacterized protein (TIGR00299 family) protein